MQNGPWVQGSDTLEYNLARASLSIIKNKCIFEWLEEEVVLLLMMGKLKEGQRGNSSDKPLESIYYKLFQI
jgi:hypothetical protein